MTEKKSLFTPPSYREQKRACAPEPSCTSNSTRDRPVGRKPVGTRALEGVTEASRSAPGSAFSGNRAQRKALPFLTAVVPGKTTSTAVVPAATSAAWHQWDQSATVSPLSVASIATHNDRVSVMPESDTARRLTSRYETASMLSAAGTCDASVTLMDKATKLLRL